MILLQLYLEFIKVGLFSVGGGLATLPFLYDLSERTGWFSQADVANMIAVAESTPGPIGVNMATYAGFTTAGVVGSIVSTLGLITPAVIVVMVIARILNHFMGNPLVEAALTGLRPASIGLIAAAGISVGKTALLDMEAFRESGSPLRLVIWPAVLLGVLIFLGQKKLPKLHPVFWILLSALVGILFHFGT